MFLTNLLENPVVSLGLVAFLLILLALPFVFWSLSIKSNSLIAKNLISIANLVLATQLLLRWIESGHFPISNLYESICFLTWAFTLTQLLIQRALLSPIIPAALTPISLIAIAFASFALPEQLQASSPLVPALKSSWLVMHVTVIMCSYAALILGSLLSLSLLFYPDSNKLQIRASSLGAGIFRKNTSDLIIPVNRNFSPEKINLPEQIDNLSYRTITVGFLLLTFGLISGAVWANEAWGSWWSWDPKETWAFISWLVYASYLHARLSKGMQGRVPAIISLIGLFVIVICYLGVNLLGIGLHSYGWFF